jgi:signal transduction histidine kinase
MNLVTNAIKYGTAGQTTIQIHIESSRDRLHIHFKDNGIGFDKRERKKIFKKFYQIGQSHDMSAKGSGIGLFLAQSIAKIHKGRIVASSPGPGKGATFTVILPTLGSNT